MTKSDQKRRPGAVFVFLLSIQHRRIEQQPHHVVVISGQTRQTGVEDHPDRSTKLDPK
jgi:hypothetical protein